MQITGVLTLNRATTGVDTFPIDIGGANIIAIAALARINKSDPNNGECIGSVFFTQYTDSTGESHSIPNALTTTLVQNGVKNLTVVTGARNAEVESVITIFLTQ